LVEVIAVLVILGILAAVAVPKYFDMQDEAKGRAIYSAYSEAVSRVSQYFGQQLLAGSVPTDVDYNNISTDLGDFTLVISNGAPGAGKIGLAVSGKSGTSVSGATRAGSMNRPGI